MEHTYWHQQTAHKPLFPDLIWSRPEHKQRAGKLLIIGGNRYGFAAAAEAYQAAVHAGVGTARVLLPDALRSTIGRTFEAGEYAPSTRSGSFSQQALESCLEIGQWADAVLVAGDLGRNSETAIMLEKYTVKSSTFLILTKDAVDYFTKAPQAILVRSNTTLVLSFAQLQTMARAVHFEHSFLFSMDLLRMVDALHDFSNSFPVNIIVKHNDMVFVAVDGHVSTSTTQDNDKWRVTYAAYAAVWWLQNIRKPFEALTMAVFTALS